jgi:hypothetical protein
MSNLRVISSTRGIKLYRDYEEGVSLSLEEAKHMAETLEPFEKHKKLVNSLNAAINHIDINLKKQIEGR